MFCTECLLAFWPASWPAVPASFMNAGLITVIRPAFSWALELGLGRVGPDSDRVGPDSDQVGPDSDRVGPDPDRVG